MKTNGNYPIQTLLLGALVFFSVMGAAFTSQAADKIGGVFSRLAQPFPAPEIAFRDARGNDSGFIEFRGKVVVAYFWATWCPICASDIPGLDKLQAKLGSDNLAVIPISIDRAENRVVRSYLEKKGLRFLQAYQDRESILAAVFGIRGTPTTFLIDRSGLVIGVSEGAADWDSPALERDLKELSLSRK